MNVHGRNFTYDGKNSADYGVILCTFETRNSLKETNITYKINRSDFTPYKSVSNIYSKSYEDVLTFDVGICKCNGAKFSPDERREIVAWMTSPNSPALFTITDFTTSDFSDNYHEDIEYFCNAVAYQEFVPTEAVRGLLFSMECNTSYGFSPEEKTPFSENSTIIIFNSSDELQQDYYPIIELTGTANGIVKIKNDQFPNDVMELSVMNNQTLLIDNQYGIITDESGKFDFSKDTNLTWLRLAPGMNKIQISGNAKGFFRCRYIRKVGI